MGLTPEYQHVLLIITYYYIYIFPVIFPIIQFQANLLIWSHLFECVVVVDAVDVALFLKEGTYTGNLTFRGLSLPKGTPWLDQQCCCPVPLQELLDPMPIDMINNPWICRIDGFSIACKDTSLKANMDTSHALTRPSTANIRQEIECYLIYCTCRNRHLEYEHSVQKSTYRLPFQFNPFPQSLPPINQDVGALTAGVK